MTRFDDLDLETLVLGRQDARGTIALAPVMKFQAPAMRCRIDTRPGYYQVVCYLDGGRPAHEAFATCLRGIERAVSALDPDTFPPDRLGSLISRDGSIRMFVRDDTDWFDASGTDIRGSSSMFPGKFRAISTILRVDAVWTKETTWGLRAKIVQAKEADVSRLRDAASMFIDM